MAKDENGACLARGSDIKNRWTSYFEKLMNVENNRERRQEVTQSANEEVDEILPIEIVKT